MNGPGGLSDPRIADVLGRMRLSAKGDKWIIVRAVLAGSWAVIRGREFFETANARLARAYIGVEPEIGELLYLTARAIKARTCVEFGTSFGMSAIYLSAAMRETGGRVTGSELEPEKVEAARANLADAGLAEFAEIRPGDALETLAGIEGPIDLVLLDGWKDMYLPMIKMLKPKLRPGAVVLGDNIHMFKKSLRPYVDYMQDPLNGFESTTLPLGSGLEYSVKL